MGESSDQSGKPLRRLYSELLVDSDGGTEVTAQRVMKTLDRAESAVEAAVNADECNELGEEVDASPVSSDEVDTPPEPQPAPHQSLIARASRTVPTVSESSDNGRRVGPPKPKSLADIGLSSAQLGEMILRSLYLQGSLTGFELAGELRLPYGLVDEPLRFLIDEKCLEVTSGQVFGRISYRFQLTDLGRTRAREAFEQCRYVGPAPVKLSDYVDYCRKQSVAGIPCHEEQLRAAFDGLVIRDGLLDELGPAVCSGRSIFLHGPSGNGKTTVAKGLGKLLKEFGGDIFIPYAIQAEGAIITLFDPTIHRPTDEKEISGANVAGRPTAASGSIEQDELWDLRWRRIRRPVVITGGEMTLSMLDLKYSSVSNYYQAPVHIKANGGVFLVDDFGRQIVSPKDLLNRWIVPLEEKIDYLTLATGKKIQVPFEQLSIFSTNLDPSELVDAAFLRRIRHKIEIGPPDEAQFKLIFASHCQQQGIEFEETALDELFAEYYDKGKESRASDARDIVETLISIAMYRDVEPQMTAENVREAAARFFGTVRLGKRSA